MQNFTPRPLPCLAWGKGGPYRASQGTTTSQERDTWLEERTVNQEKILTASSFKLFLRLILLKVLFCIGIQSVGLQESDTTQPLNNNNKIVVSQRCVTFKHTAKWLSYTLSA